MSEMRLFLLSNDHRLILGLFTTAFEKKKKLTPPVLSQQDFFHPHTHTHTHTHTTIALSPHDSFGCSTFSCRLQVKFTFPPISLRNFLSLSYHFPPEGLPNTKTAKMEPSTLEIGSLKKELPDGMITTHFLVLRTILTPPAVLGGRYPPSSKNRNLLEPVTLEELKKETHHGGKLIYLKVREWAWSTGWLLVVEDSKGTIDRMHVLCDVFQGKKEEAKTGALIAVKEPFYGMCALHVDAIRVDHPSDVILISRHDSTACELFPGTISSSPNTAKEWIDVTNKYFDEGDMTEVLIW